MPAGGIWKKQIRFDDVSRCENGKSRCLVGLLPIPPTPYRLCMDLELRHLRVVCAIADAGSVTKAASALGLAQPALTAQLQRIQRALGGLRFERDRPGARATPLGELVLARARVLLPAGEGLRGEGTP